MSSEHDVEVVRIGAIHKHPHADALSITTVRGCPVILRTGEFAEGDLAVYLPVDSIVPQAPRWAFLGDHRRIRAKRLRGIFSMGLLAAPEADMALGELVGERLGIQTYEPPVEMHTSGDNEADPGFIPAYTDVESWRRWQEEVFDDDADEVVATEKIHGANGRFVWARGRLWCASRTFVKAPDPRSVWWQAAAGAGLAEKLQQAEGIVIYGEVYGALQDLRYGVAAGVRFVAFDALDSATRRYLDRDAFVALCARLDLPVVPELFRGSVSALRAVADATANGKSVLAPGACVREGFVVRPVVERWHRRLGRVVLKLVGEDFLLRKGG